MSEPFDFTRVLDEKVIDSLITSQADAILAMFEKGK